MRPLVDLAKRVDGHFGVDLSGGHRSVAKKLLNNANIGPTRENMGSKGVTKSMRGDQSLKACSIRRALHNKPRVLAG